MKIISYSFGHLGGVVKEANKLPEKTASYGESFFIICDSNFLKRHDQYKDIHIYFTPKEIKLINDKEDNLYLTRKDLHDLLLGCCTFDVDRRFIEKIDIVIRRGITMTNIKVNGDFFAGQSGEERENYDSYLIIKNHEEINYYFIIKKTLFFTKAINLIRELKEEI